MVEGKTSKKKLENINADNGVEELENVETIKGYVDMGSIEKNTNVKSEKRKLEIDEMDEASERVRKKDKKAVEVRKDDDRKKWRKEGKDKKIKKRKGEGDLETDETEGTLTGMDKNDMVGSDHETEDGNKMRRKKTQSDKYNLEGLDPEAEDGMKKKTKVKKRVPFLGNVEVFLSSGDEKKAIRNYRSNGEFVRGRRFTPKEDVILEQASQDYISVHNLGENGRDRILDLKENPELRGCWREIQLALPWRPLNSVYSRGHTLLGRGDSFRTWTPEDREKVLKFYEEHGPQWKELADQLGKYRHHVKDAYCRYKLLNAKKGGWSQDEYQKLFDLVNLDLQVRAFEEKKSKYGMLRDNICWGAISDRLGTRITTSCCLKWYAQLSSSMVTEGIWSDIDDYHLIDALYNLDACCIEDVDWDKLLEHRSGELCRKRWNQMARHIGEHAYKSFADQVEILSQRYCPDLSETRELFDSKPFVDKVSPNHKQLQAGS